MYQRQFIVKKNVRKYSKDNDENKMLREICVAEQRDRWISREMADYEEMSS
jgi:hypothetical protein